MTVRHFAKRWWPAILLLAGGCNLIGALAAKTAPPPSVPAQYVLPQRPTVVLVENYRLTSDMGVDADLLARQIESELKDHQKAPLVNSQAVSGLREQKGQKFRDMRIAEIG